MYIDYVHTHTYIHTWWYNQSAGSHEILNHWHETSTHLNLNHTHLLPYIFFEILNLNILKIESQARRAVSSTLSFSNLFILPTHIISREKCSDWRFEVLKLDTWIFEYLNMQARRAAWALRIRSAPAVTATTAARRISSGSKLWIPLPLITQDITYTIGLLQWINSNQDSIIYLTHHSAYFRLARIVEYLIHIRYIVQKIVIYVHLNQHLNHSLAHQVWQGPLDTAGESARVGYGAVRSVWILRCAQRRNGNRCGGRAGRDG